ncbi:MAG TPA: RNA polymerase sigma-70 factor [Acidobacteriaceae bacterium]|jgi:RNA polymerase sigma-70 factor (ECF subfamily)
MPLETSETGALDHAASVFLSVRPRLFGIAYRMLGSASEAEDLVQDVWLKWQLTDRSKVLEPPAFLSTMTTRLAINVVQSARVQRETYIGPWLPEPVDTSTDPELGAARGEALQLAVLLLLEKLTPTERASYVLREAFDYSYREIADILQLSEANTRQLVTRARKHIADERRTAVSSIEQRRLLETFLSAAQQGNISALEGLFAADVVSYSDGGGVARAARIPVAGRERVASFIASFASHYWTGVTTQWTEANGQPSALFVRDGVAFASATIDASPEGIYQILWMLNPAKLGALSQSSRA